MTKNQVGSLLNKQQYETPNYVVSTFVDEDVITASGVGEMAWGWTEENWNQNRDNTFVG